MKKILLASFLFISGSFVSIYAQNSAALGDDIIYDAAHSSDSSKIKAQLIANFKAEPLSETYIQELYYYGTTYMAFEKDNKKDMALYKELLPYIDQSIKDNDLVLRFYLNKIDLANFANAVEDAANTLIYIIKKSPKIEYSWSVDSGFLVYSDAADVYSDLETRFVSLAESDKTSQNIALINTVMQTLEAQEANNYIANTILSQMSYLLGREQDAFKYIDKAINLDKNNVKAYYLAFDYAQANKDKSLKDKYFKMAQKNVTNPEDMDNIKAYIKN